MKWRKAFYPIKLKDGSEDIKWGHNVEEIAPRAAIHAYLKVAYHHA